MTTPPTNSKMRELQLPISRVKSIMKRADNVESIGGDGLFLVAKAAVINIYYNNESLNRLRQILNVLLIIQELFIHHLTTEAHDHSNKGNNLDYKHLAEAVQSSGAMDFLHEIVPRKITVRKFKELMAREAAEHSSSDESSSDSDSDSQTDSETGSDNDSTKPDHDKDDSSSDVEDNKINGKSEISKSDSDSKTDTDDDN